MKAFPHFWRMETISGDGLCPVYLYRWVIVRTRWFCVYLHHFVGNDWALDPHDHPKTFISIGLIGEYVEDDYTDLSAPVTRLFRAPWIRKFSATYRHRIRMTERRSCWTICIVGRQLRDWGFWFNSAEWIKWNEYVWGGKGARRKDC